MRAFYMGWKNRCDMLSAQFKNAWSGQAFIDFNQHISIVKNWFYGG
jgi:hypothetical protein